MTEQFDFLFGFIIGIICGLLIMSIVAGSYENKISNLCNKHQYDFCIEEKNWRLKDDKD